MKRLHVTALLAGCATLAALGQAGAGGYSRGTADTDLIFEEGNFNMRAERDGRHAEARLRHDHRAGQRTESALFRLQAIPAGTYKSTDPDYTQTYAIPSTRDKVQRHGRPPLRRNVYAALWRRLRNTDRRPS